MLSRPSAEFLLACGFDHIEDPGRTRIATYGPSRGDFEGTQNGRIWPYATASRSPGHMYTESIWH